jgi:hypothetical protein
MVILIKGKNKEFNTKQRVFMKGFHVFIKSRIFKKCLDKTWQVTYEVRVGKEYSSIVGGGKTRLEAMESAIMHLACLKHVEEVAADVKFQLKMADKYRYLEVEYYHNVNASEVV